MIGGLPLQLEWAVRIPQALEPLECCDLDVGKGRLQVICSERDGVSSRLRGVLAMLKRAGNVA